MQVELANHRLVNLPKAEGLKRLNLSAEGRGVEE